MRLFVRCLTCGLIATMGLATARGNQPPPATAGRPSVRPSGWTVPRTLDGQPDLQGVWRNNSATPLERPIRLGNRKFLTEDELKGLNDLAVTLSRISDDHSSWLGDLDFDNRTSLIVAPANGRVPPLTRQARARAQAEADVIRERGPADSYEDRPLSERCITFGVPDLLAGYNSYVQIAQTTSHVAISAERIHDVRIIPLDARPHLPSTIRLWNGDSRGRWQGESLIVDTTNFSARSTFRESAENRRLTERFTRTAPDTLEYEITVSDPTTWSKPWTLMVRLRRAEDRIYEYACHEGNDALRGMLAGARGDERTSADGNARKDVR